MTRMSAKFSESDRSGIGRLLGGVRRWRARAGRRSSGDTVAPCGVPRSIPTPVSLATRPACSCRGRERSTVLPGTAWSARRGSAGARADRAGAVRRPPSRHQGAGLTTIRGLPGGGARIAPIDVPPPADPSDPCSVTPRPSRTEHEAAARRRRIPPSWRSSSAPDAVGGLIALTLTAPPLTDPTPVASTARAVHEQAGDPHAPAPSSSPGPRQRSRPVRAAQALAPVAGGRPDLTPPPTDAQLERGPAHRCGPAGAGSCWG